MGIRSATIMIFLLGFTMNGIVGPGGRVMVVLESQEKRTRPVTNASHQRPVEMAQKDEQMEAETKESFQPEQKKATSEKATPKASTRPEEALPKDFVPSEKIPADQAVDFPTDI